MFSNYMRHASVQLQVNTDKYRTGVFWFFNAAVRFITAHGRPREAFAGKEIDGIVGPSFPTSNSLLFIMFMLTRTQDTRREVFFFNFFFSFFFSVKTPVRCVHNINKLNRALLGTFLVLVFSKISYVMSSRHK